MVRILEIETYAKEHNIPIMEKEGIEYLTNYIQEHKIHSILEIGSAIGYSAIQMARISKDIHVTTIERDEERYKEAIKNIQDFKLNRQIDILFSDAFDVELEQKYDLIFIDAAKSQYIKFFEKFKHNLKKTGVIFSDNLKFHGLVEGTDQNLSRNVKGIVRKLRNYIIFLKENQEFETIFLDIGDGISISWYR